MFLLGVFWKRASGKSAFITLVAGMALGSVAFYLDWNHIYRGDFMLIAFLLFVACLVIMIVTTFLFPEPLKAEAELLVWEDWREPLRGDAGGRGLANYRVVSAVYFVGVYWRSILSFAEYENANFQNHWFSCHDRLGLPAARRRSRRNVLPGSRVSNRTRRRVMNIFMPISGRA